MPGFSELVPVLVGGALSLAGSWGAVWWTKNREELREARQLARAFKGEISAITHIAEAREYVHHLREIADRCVENNAVLIFSIQAREEYRAVYKANVGKLGNLEGSLPTEIAILYTQVASILEDFRCLEEAKSNPQLLSFLGATPADAALTYTRIADLAENAIERGKAVITDIDQRYPV